MFVGTKELPAADDAEPPSAVVLSSLLGLEMTVTELPIIGGVEKTGRDGPAGTKMDVLVVPEADVGAGGVTEVAPAVFSPSSDEHLR